MPCSDLGDVTSGLKYVIYSLGLSGGSCVFREPGKVVHLKVVRTLLLHCFGPGLQLIVCRIGTNDTLYEARTLAVDG